MRHLFLIIMIALLPLRGWVSDAMATGMAATEVQSKQQIAIKIEANNADDAAAKANFDLETMTTETGLIAADCSDHAFGTHLHTADAHCDSCSACQACHTVALSPAAAEASAVFNLGTLPRAAAAQFASAEAVLGEKTPIS